MNSTRFAGLLVLLALSALLLATPLSAQMCRGPLPRYGDENEYHAVTADLNGDGAPDVAALAGPFFRRDVAVFLNQGDGTLGPEARYPVGDEPAAIVVAELDGQPGPDIAVANEDSMDVSVLLNQGDGTFAAEVRCSLLAPPVHILAVDLDGDGPLDLVTVHRVTEEIGVLPGNGDGTFQAAAYTGGLIVPKHAVAVDVDGANGPDLAVAEESEGVVLLRNDGTGALSVGDRLPMPYGARGVTAGDLDGTNGPDLAVAFQTTLGLYLYYNAGDGTFPTPPIDVGAYGWGPWAIGSVDGSGGPDLVSEAPGGIVVLFDGGDGSPDRVGILEGGGGSTGVSVADMDGRDGPDLVTGVRARSEGVVIRFNRGGGRFDETPWIGTGRDSQRIVAADLDGDTVTDLATANGRDYEVSVHLNGGNGAFPSETRYAVGRGFVDGMLLVADLDGREGPDLITTNSSSHDISVLLNNGDGTFAPEVRYDHDEAERATIADFDGVNGPDLALPKDQWEEISLFFNDGNGAFAPETSFRIIDWRPQDLCAGDFDGVNGPDLAVTAYQNGWDEYLLLLLNDGSGAFSRPTVIAEVPWKNYPMLCADLDGANGPDVVVAHHQLLQVFLSNGDGTFQPAAQYGIGGNLALFDMDGANGPDLVISDGWNYEVVVLHNQGDGTFGGMIRYRGGPAPWALVAAQLGGFDSPDIAVLNPYYDRISILTDCPEPVWLLRNDEITSRAPLNPTLDLIFDAPASMASSLTLLGPNGVPDEGEGGPPEAPGSADDDDAYIRDFPSGALDPDTLVVGDPDRPLIFYQVTYPSRTLKIVRDLAQGIRILY